jgi:type IV secretory pathway VirB3-like protein
VFGVPLLAFLFVAGSGFLAGMYLLVYLSVAWMAVVAGLTVFALLWMRGLTRNDDQRLRQAFIAARLAIGCPNRGFWQCRSYSAMVLRGGSDAWRR